jgi:hypothetical protein
MTAHNDETLEELWAFPTGITIKAPPMTCSANGEQFLAVIAGSGGGDGGYPDLANMQTGAMLYVFALDKAADGYRPSKKKGVASRPPLFTIGSGRRRGRLSG